jgi:hypothetical protein
MPSLLYRTLTLGIPEVLNTIAVGYSNNALIGTEIFPVVKTKKETVLVPTYGKGHLRIYESERAIRGDARVIAPDDVSSNSFTLEEHTLSTKIDKRELEAAQADGNLIDLTTLNTKMLVDSLLLRREYLIADMLQDSSNFASGMRVDLSGTDQFTHSSSHPLVIIQTGIDAMKAKGVQANTITFGMEAWKSFKAHADVIQACFGPYSTGVVTEDRIADLFSTKENKFTVRVGQSVIENTSSVVTDIWRDNVIIARVAEGRGDKANIYTPSAGYSLQKYNTAEPIIAAGFEDPVTQKIYLINATIVMKIALLMTDALYLIEDTNV